MPALNVYRAADGTWFLLIVTPDKLAEVAKAIGRPDLLTDPRFSDPAKLMANMAPLTEHSRRSVRRAAHGSLAEVFGAVHVTFRPRARAGGSDQRSAAATERDRRSESKAPAARVTSTISSPIQVQGVAKGSRETGSRSRRAQRRGSRATRFDAKQIEGFRAKRHDPASVAPAKAAAGGGR